MKQTPEEKAAFAAAWEYIGGLSSPSKMPGYAYGIPASACKAGSRLAEVEGSVCHGCYALKGFYRMANVQTAQSKRLDSLRDLATWERSMVAVLLSPKVRESRYFRWHDSGDLQSVAHLAAIVRVATATPWLSHWLPTRETAIVGAFAGAIPSNLVIRLSLAMVDTKRPATMTGHSSGVFRDLALADGSACPARTQGNVCGDCRACWDPAVAHVVYEAH